ncbi:Cerato-platanin [Lentinus tigrinus ALCF2SS1-7]|uniref:Cerato-platanin n=1 Tax=Lentinus tigrinus ALCF2SS1-6 TaxID=1328759 RepID=A0A5C2RWX8_9APHY|nr:Cerato-platanin [Lentinus tigrinus ALCF2SS1-6]RPD69068.1 Cerato-platanin [Lentinus tigrinus ALCF2SS1-7]
MQFKALSLSLLALVASALGATTSHPVTVSYDNVYDNPNTPFSAVSCSDGSRGFITKGYNSLGSLHLRVGVYVGGAGVIGGWNSPQCGTCWKLSYGNSGSIYVVGIDHTGDGWNIPQSGMDALTGGQASQLGRVEAVATIVDNSWCGV